jgi:hypothetical protein
MPTFGSSSSSPMRLSRFFLVLAALAPLAGRAQPMQFASGAQRVALIELFTSEGCSSCPPADLWLGALRAEPGLWRDFVPIAFHVNYWDNLGWKDRLASPRFTARQYALASDWGTSSVYTPCFVRNGAEWHPGAHPMGLTGEAAGVLRMEVEGGRCQVRWSPANPGREARYEVHVAVLGGGLFSKVTAGENRGSRLAHEFVALGLTDRPLAPQADGSQGAEFLLPDLSVSDAPRQGIAAWVTGRKELAPLQATGGWLGPRA